MAAQVPLNPLDLLLYAADEARRLAGAPGGDIHLYLECDGQIDVEGLRDALRALWRRYPVTAARLHQARWTQRPAWRLTDDDEISTDAAITVQFLENASADGLQRATETLLAGRVNWTQRPPLQLHVLRGAADGDTVVMRWPHFLMDARGGAALLEELAALCESRGRRAGAASAGDEKRRDFGTLEPAGTIEMLRALRRASRPPVGWRDLRLCGEFDDAVTHTLRVQVLRFSSEAAAEIRAAALRVCGFARLADFLRAAAIQALHRTIAPKLDATSGYSTLHLIDNRRRRDPGPVCHNIFSTSPVHIPATEADDIRRVADHIRDASSNALHSRDMAVRLALLGWMARLPMRWLTEFRRRPIKSRHPSLPIGLARPPSLPLGFMGPLAHATERFCGARLRNLFGVQAPAPRGGYAVNVNAAQERMNVAVTYYEPLVDRARVAAFLGAYRHALLGDA